MKTVRVTLPMQVDQRREVADAAALLGLTVTSFATEVLVKRARQVKLEHEITLRNDQERVAFLQLTSNPQSSESLVKLMGGDHPA